MIQASDVIARARPRGLSRAEYDRLVEDGIFRGERVELVAGIVVEMPPIGPAHADPIDFLTRHFVHGVGDAATVRVQLSFAASENSAPEPDLALVPMRRYHDRHPDTAFLIVEVSDTSLAHDRETKAPLYAACGVPEYWIVDVNARHVEVYDTPVNDRYQQMRTFKPGDTLAPSAFPDVRLAIAELFP